MKNHKYVRFNNDIVTFNAIITHSEMVRALTGTTGVYRKEDLKSAGFVGVVEECHPDFPNPGLTCYGESWSLKLKALPEDSEILQRQMYGSSYEPPNKST